MSADRSTRSLMMGGTLFLTLLSIAAAPIEIVRVRVPSDKVNSWFAKGSERVSMPIAEFEALVQKVQTSTQGRRESPTLLQAVHRAQWMNGELVGETTLTVQRGSKAGSLPLVPFNLSLDSAKSTDSQIRAGDTGDVSVWVPPIGSSDITIFWRCPARSNSQGRSFSLELPHVALASLELDLPDDLRPEGLVVVAPSSGKATPGRRSWQKLNAAGKVDIRLRTAASEPSPNRSLPWVSGPMMIDLGPASIHWRCEWNVDLNGLSRTLSVRLSTGLEPVEVTGPGVESFQIVQTGQQALIKIQFRPDLNAATPVVIRGVAALSTAKTWIVPAARPEDGVWTGGTTTVRLDRSHAVQDCRILQGRRIAPKAIDPPDKTVFIFEPQRPEPPAELTFMDSQPLEGVEVHGTIRSTSNRTKLAADLRWKFPQGKVVDLIFDLPNDWSIEGMTQDEEPLAWHQEAFGPHQIRVKANPTPIDEDSLSSTIHIEATRTAVSSDEEIEMPRIRPVGVTVTDNTWVALADGNRGFTPRIAQGLAWINPLALKSSRFQAETPPLVIENGLAWRWTAESGRLIASIVAAPRETNSITEGRAVIANKRMRTDWRLSIQPGTQKASFVPVFWTVSPSSPVVFRLAGAHGQDQAVATRPLTATERVEAGLPLDHGLALAILWPARTTETFSVHVAIDQPWNGSESVPLLVLGASYHPRSEISLEIEDTLLLQVESSGIEEGEAGENPPAMSDPLSSTPTRLRPASRFSYQATDPQLKLTTSPARRRSSSLLVTSAHLASIFSESGPQLQRLVMALRSASSESLTVKMPDKARVHRVLRDGELIRVALDGDTLEIPMTPTEQALLDHLVIEYDVPQDPTELESGRFRPRLPTFNSPCLRFSWRMVLPSYLSPGSHGDGWVGDTLTGSTDLNSRLTWATHLFHTTWSSRDRQELNEIKATVDRVASEFRTRPNATLSEFLSDLDSGPSPILIDAIGLEELGLTPTSRWDSKAAESQTSGSDPPYLIRGDLAFIPFKNGYILTCKKSNLIKQLKTFLHLDSLAKAVATAWLYGVEPSGRFQSVDAWIEQKDFEEIRVGLGDVWILGDEVIFRGNGWPGSNAWVQVDHSFRNQQRSLVLALLLLIVGVLIQTLLVRGRSLFLALLISLSVGSIGFGSFLDLWIRDGLCIGAIGVILIRLTIQRKRLTPESLASDQSNRLRQVPSVSGSNLVVSLIFILVVGSSASLSARDEAANKQDPILVLLPYDGPPNLDERPTRAVLRLMDLERIRAMIAPESQSVSRHIWSFEAIHHLEFNDHNQAYLNSEFGLIVDTVNPTEWRVPTEGAREIHATIDGQFSPIRVIEEGRVAVLTLTGEGKHRLILRRLVKSSLEGQTLRCDAAVNPVPLCRLQITAPPDRTRIDLDGGVTHAQTRSGFLGGDFGPSRQLTVGFHRSDPKLTSATKTAFSGLGLWDARPAGDRVQFRLMVSDARPVSTLRLILEPGTELRFSDSRRLTDERWEGLATAPEWVGTFDSPYRRGEEIVFELWRSLPPVSPSNLDQSLRKSPSLSIGGDASFSGVLAFRRPGDWSGRLVSRSGFDALDEESFVKAWGTLPEDPLTLAGARGFQNVAIADVVTRPIRLIRTVQPSMKVDLVEGRLNFVLEADIKDDRGRSTDIDLMIPATMILDHFTMDGLAALSRPEAGRLHLDLKPLENPSRKLMLRGHLTTASATQLADGHSFQSLIPWPSWRDANEQPGLLTITSAVKPQFVLGSGIVPASIVDELVAAIPLPLFRKVYQVNRSADLGLVSWQAPAPIVAAHLLSRLSVSETTLRLESTIRYESSGGPLEALYVKLPAVWAKDADVELVGNSVQRTTETRGEWTFWTLRPEHPIWGAGRLVVRSLHAIPFGESFAYPDVIPLGQGSVEKTLSVERRTAAPVEIEGSSGLQSIDFSRVTGLEFVDSGHSSVDAYRVKGERWGLNLRVQGDRQEKRATNQTVVRSIETFCHLDQLGSTLARSTLAVDGRRGSTLAFKLAEDADVVWCQVDRTPVIALSERPGVWCVPIESRGDGVVEFLWASPRSKVPRNAYSVEFPYLSDGDVPTLIRVFSSPGLAIDGFNPGMEEISSPILMLERTERIARRIVAMISRFDRSTNLHELAVRAYLTRFERDERATKRSAEAITLASPVATQEFRNQIKSRLDRTREVVIDSLINNGLDDLSKSPVKILPRSLVNAREDRPSRSDYLSIGEIHDFRSLTSTSGQIHRLEWSVRPKSIWAEVSPAIGLWVVGISIIMSPSLCRSRVTKSRALLWCLAIGMVVLAFFWPVPGFIWLIALAIGISASTNEIEPVTFAV